jgi:hypothetical protein
MGDHVEGCDQNAAAHGLVFCVACKPENTTNIYTWHGSYLSLKAVNKVHNTLNLFSSIYTQCCGTGNVTVTFCRSGTGTVINQGSGAGIGTGTVIK